MAQSQSIPFSTDDLKLANSQTPNNIQKGVIPFSQSPQPKVIPFTSQEIQQFSQQPQRPQKTTQEVIQGGIQEAPSRIVPGQTYTPGPQAGAPEKVVAGLGNFLFGGAPDIITRDITAPENDALKKDIISAGQQTINAFQTRIQDAQNKGDTTRVDRLSKQLADSIQSTNDLLGQDIFQKPNWLQNVGAATTIAATLAPEALSIAGLAPVTRAGRLTESALTGAGFFGGQTAAETGQVAPTLESTGLGAGLGLALPLGLSAAGKALRPVAEAIKAPERAANPFLRMAGRAISPVANVISSVGTKGSELIDRLRNAQTTQDLMQSAYDSQVKKVEQLTSGMSQAEKDLIYEATLPNTAVNPDRPGLFTPPAKTTIAAAPIKEAANQIILRGDSISVNELEDQLVAKGYKYNTARKIIRDIAKEIGTSVDRTAAINAEKFTNLVDLQDALNKKLKKGLTSTVEGALPIPKAAEFSPEEIAKQSVAQPTGGMVKTTEPLPSAKPLAKRMYTIDEIVDMAKKDPRFTPNVEKVLREEFMGTKAPSEAQAGRTFKTPGSSGEKRTAEIAAPFTHMTYTDAAKKGLIPDVSTRVEELMQEKRFADIPDPELRRVRAEEAARAEIKNIPSVMKAGRARIKNIATAAQARAAGLETDPVKLMIDWGRKNIRTAALAQEFGGESMFSKPGASLENIVNDNITKQYLIPMEEELKKTIGQRGVTASEVKKVMGIIKNSISPVISGEDISLGQTLRSLRKFQMLKIPFAFIPHAFQVLNATLSSDLPSLATGLKAALTSMGRDFATEAGAKGEIIFSEKTGGMFNKILDAANKQLTKPLKYVMDWNGAVFANTGATMASKFADSYNKLLESGLETQANDALKTVEDLIGKKFNPSEAISLTKEDLLRAGNRFTKANRFGPSTLEMPYWTNSAWGKTFFQFKNYFYRYTIMLT